jgi:ribosome-binding protein aMBF1 (putative translation factor)
MRKSVHATVKALLLTPAEQAEHASRVQALLARNALLTALESAREQQGMSKAKLAERAGLEASSVRRMLTSETANPTTNHAFRLMAAMDVALEAILPSGERVAIIPRQRVRRPARGLDPRPE